MPRRADEVIRYPASDPNCPWCGGTGHIKGVEPQLWGGRPDCEHVWEETPPRRSRQANDAGGAISRNNRGASYDALGGRFCLQCGAWSGHLGLEPTPDLYVSHLLMVFREVWRVLRDDGTFWLEIGDTYLTHPAGLTGAKRWKAPGLRNRDQTGAEQAGSIDKRQPGIREGNLALIPHRVAIALQEDGWIVRQDNVWARPNPVPESVKNRSTRAHSYVFLLAKEPGYFYDGQAVRQPKAGISHSGGNGSVRKPLAEAGYGIRSNESYRAAMVDQPPPEDGRNLLSVWTIPIQAFHGVHFATFPERVPEIAVLAGTSERGACPECGRPWTRKVRAIGGGIGRRHEIEIEGNLVTGRSPVVNGPGWHDGTYRVVTVGWTPTCRCYPDPCDRCGTAWVQETIQRRVSTMNIRVRDAKKGILGQKAGLGGIVADATKEEIDAYGTVDRPLHESYRMEETEVRWPGCKCRAPVPCIVLDPFAGSGTTLATAKRLGRRSVGVELNPLYVDLIRQRLAETRTEAVHYPGQLRLDLFVQAPMPNGRSSEILAEEL